jgi:nucleotide-binding universal stress UspA family protein
VVLKHFVMANILVPTDFTPASLKLAENALRNGSFEKCNLILFHAFALPSSPFDLLGASSSNPSGELMTEKFRQACKQLKDDYPQKVNKIVVRCMTGDTRAVFRNFAEANDIDLIYCPDEYVFKPAHARSVDPVYLFKKCGIPVVKTSTWKPEPVFRPAYFSTVQVSTQ